MKKLGSRLEGVAGNAPWRALGPFTVRCVGRYAVGTSEIPDAGQPSASRYPAVRRNAARLIGEKQHHDPASRRLGGEKWTRDVQFGSWTNQFRISQKFGVSRLARGLLEKSACSLNFFVALCGEPS